MFFKRFFKKDKPQEKPLIICVHGFGRRRADEFIPLVEALKDEYDFIIPNLYDQQYPEDNVWHSWVSRAEEEIVKAKNANRKIYLLGFSMGGVIASYLASRFNVEKLVLLAPAFEYFVKQAQSRAKSVIQKAEPVVNDGSD